MNSIVKDLTIRDVLAVMFSLGVFSLIWLKMPVSIIPLQKLWISETTYIVFRSMVTSMNQVRFGIKFALRTTTGGLLTTARSQRVTVLRINAWPRIGTQAERSYGTN